MFKVSRKTRPSFASGFARSSAEAENPGLWKDCIFHWDASLGVTGDRAVDVSTYKNHSTSATGIDGSNWVMSPYGWVLQFDGVDDYFDFGVVDSVQLGLGNASLTALIKVQTAIDVYGSIAGNGSLGNAAKGHGLFVEKSTGLVYYQVRDKDVMSPAVNSNSVIADDGLWHMVTGVLDRAGEQALYVDGVKQTDVKDGTNFAAVNLDDSTKFTIGTRHSPTAIPYLFDYKGQIAKVIQHNRALTPSEIKQLYEDPHAITRQRSRIFAVTNRTSPWYYRAQESLICG